MNGKARIKISSGIPPDETLFEKSIRRASQGLSGKTSADYDVLLHRPDSMARNTVETNELPTVLLIGGHPRSGTTMLNWICNTHPKIFVTQELKCYVKLDVPKKVHLKAINKHGRMWVKILLNLQILLTSSRRTWLRWFRSAYISYRYYWRIRLLRKRKIDACDVTRQLAALYPNAAIVGDKYPGYVFMLDRLVDIPSVRIVIIYRDCRDVVNSCMKKYQGRWRGTIFGLQLGTPEGAARNWVRAIKSMEKFSGNIHAIQYESLISNPEKELAGLGKWLGVEPEGFDSSMIHKDSIGRHRNELNINDLTVIDEIAGKQQRILGY